MDIHRIVYMYIYYYMNIYHKNEGEEIYPVNY